MKIKTHIIRLKSKYPFRIAHGVREFTETFIVELSDGKVVGYGEATPVPYYGVSPQNMDDLINEHRNAIEEHELNHPKDYWEYLKSILSNNHFVQCAIDLAAYDLWGKKNNLPIYKMLNLDISKNLCSDYTIGIDEISTMISKLKEFDFPIYKIKLGTEHDIEIVKALRKETNAVFRVDANCAWGVDETLKNAEIMAKLNVEFIEQPLQAQAFEEMKYIKKMCKLPLIADESCIEEKDVELCKEGFDGINIKLAKCGGITPALRMIEKAKSLDLKIMMGCMTESSIGISAIAQLVPLLHYVDMDGAMLIANDPAEGVKLENGTIIYPDKPGLGVNFKHI